MRLKKFFRPDVVAFLTAAIIISILALFAFVAVQQDLRQTANDPQIQTAEDASFALSTGQIVPTAKPTSTRVDMEQSLSTAIFIYNDTGEPTYATGQLDGKTPVPPKGVLEAARTYGENRVTWQPKPGVRMAAVVRRVNGKNAGFVLVARSLREVEKRETAIQQMLLLAWGASMLVLIAGTLVVARMRRRPVQR